MVELNEMHHYFVTFLYAVDDSISVGVKSEGRRKESTIAG